MRAKAMQKRLNKVRRGNESEIKSREGKVSVCLSVFTLFLCFSAPGTECYAGQLKANIRPLLPDCVVFEKNKTKSYKLKY